MKCKICEKYFISETKFKNLFVFEDTCDECKSIYDISPKLEVFPIEKGLVKYIYLYDDLLVNFKQKEYLNKYSKILFQYIVKTHKHRLVIIVDDFTYKDLEEEIEYLFGFKNIIFMSLFRYDFVDCVNFN